MNKRNPLLPAVAGINTLRKPAAAGSRGYGV